MESVLIPSGFPQCCVRRRQESIALRHRGQARPDARGTGVRPRNVPGAPAPPGFHGKYGGRRDCFGAGDGASHSIGLGARPGSRPGVIEEGVGVGLSTGPYPPCGLRAGLAFHRPFRLPGVGLGAPGGIRTRDLRLAKALLCPLSYGGGPTPYFMFT